MLCLFLALPPLTLHHKKLGHISFTHLPQDNTISTSVLCKQSIASFYI